MVLVRGFRRCDASKIYLETCHTSVLAANENFLHVLCDIPQRTVIEIFHVTTEQMIRAMEPEHVSELGWRRAEYGDDCVAWVLGAKRLMWRKLGVGSGVCLAFVQPTNAAFVIYFWPDPGNLQAEHDALGEWVALKPPFLPRALPLINST